MNQNLAVRTRQSFPLSAGHSTDRRIRAFINGESHGEDVLRALYGDAADEAVPERLRTLLRR